ncbi:MAG: phosphatidylglycerol:prolipoprotein diacylglycerol transferase [Paracoccaceae bacterium]|jgi:phosphatidylglycerol:prolipoprotein diacylglycerol transferase
MNVLITFPEIHPELFSVSLFGMSFALRWYALAYITGILLALWLAIRAVATPRLWQDQHAPMNKAQLEDLLTWIILGIVIGGRLGFVLFYKPAYYFANPAEILLVWQGGMAFHGGFLGVVVAALVFCHRHGLARLSVADTLALVVAPGLFLGRLANFINAELWGRASDAPWAMKFPTMCVDPAWQGCLATGAWFYQGDEVARHPSQLYQAGLEGLVLGVVLMLLAYRGGALKRPGMITGVFLAGYGASRYIVEFFRQPDAHFASLENPVGFAIGSGHIGITMGQLLSVPMILVGLALIWMARRGARKRDA